MSLAQNARPEDTLDVAGFQNFRNVIGYTGILTDPEKKLSAGDALTRTFTPLEQFKYYRTIPPDMVPYAFFLKIHLKNSGDTAKAFYFFPGAYFDHTTLYTVSGGRITNASLDGQEGYSRFSLDAHSSLILMARLRPLKFESVFIRPQLISDGFLNDYKKLAVSLRLDVRSFGFMLSGVLLMMILFMSTNFIIGRKKEYLYNALYSGCMFLLICLNSFLLRTYSAFTNFFMGYFDFFLLLTGTIFYISFTRLFLDTASRYSALDRTLKYSNIFLWCMVALFTGLHFLTPNYAIQFYLEYIIKILSLILGVYFIIMALRQHNPLLNYLAIGNAFLVFFSSVSLALILLEVKVTVLWNSPLFYYYLGIMMELIFFLLGLTYKNRKELIERTKEQEAMKLENEKKEYETKIAIMKAQQEERNRISADMHDDLGAGVTTIRLYSELARQKLGERLIPEIDKISSSSDELLTNMNAIIWSMSSSNDTLGNTIAYIRSYALEYFENSGISCQVTLPEKVPEIMVPGEIRRNIFLVVKEALHNVFKHSKATEVKMTLERHPDGLSLYIHDNGIGIDPEKLRQFGNGLKNMKKRMQDINGHFSIENKDGTLITLHRLVNQFISPGKRPGTS